MLRTGLALLGLTLVGPASANTLLTGSATLNDGATVPFTLSGNSREDVIGGSIEFADSTFEITAVSEHNLVGAQRKLGDKVELVLFSSSYSRVTDTGKPWVQATEHHNCDEPYNSFLAIYELESALVAELPDPPYWQVGENPADASSASVYCFMSQPERD